MPAPRRIIAAMTIPFERALAHRVDAMLDACTRCGKCVEACPIIGPAAVDAPPVAVISGVIDILRTGDGPGPSRRWAEACTLSGECIAACDQGVNPRFLLAMARAAMLRAMTAPAVRRQHGIDDYRKVGHDVGVLSRMQLTSDMLARLGQRTPSRPPDGAAAPPPDVVFYTGCNVLKTPHIALLALDILDALGVSYTVAGGPAHCCGIVQFRTGDLETAGRMAESTFNKLSRSRNGQVLSWCASCHVQFTEVTLPAHERAHGRRPLEMTPFLLFLQSRLGALRPLLRHSVPLRVAMHRHSGLPGVMDAAAEILRAVPGIEFVDLKQPAVGLMSNYLRTLPAFRRGLRRDELDAARLAQVDALVTVHHADHRELCAHERDYPFRIVNLLEIVGASMGFAHDDQFKRLKKLQDVELIIAEVEGLLREYAIGDQSARQAVKAMLDEQPLPLRN
jgi:heterodisulfide reductase subunit D